MHRCHSGRARRGPRILWLQVRSGHRGHGARRLHRPGRGGALLHLQGVRAAQPHGVPHRLHADEPRHRGSALRAVPREAGADEGPGRHRGRRGRGGHRLRVRAVRPRDRRPARGFVGQGGVPSVLGHRLARGHLAHGSPRGRAHRRALLGTPPDLRRLGVPRGRHRARARAYRLHRARLRGALRRLPTRDIPLLPTLSAGHPVPAPHVPRGRGACAAGRGRSAGDRGEPRAGGLADPGQHPRHERRGGIASVAAAHWLGQAGDHRGGPGAGHLRDLVHGRAGLLHAVHAAQPRDPRETGGGARGRGRFPCGGMGDRPRRCGRAP